MPLRGLPIEIEELAHGGLEVFVGEAGPGPEDHLGVWSRRPSEFRFVGRQGFEDHPRHDLRIGPGPAGDRFIEAGHLAVELDIGLAHRRIPHDGHPVSHEAGLDDGHPDAEVAELEVEGLGESFEGVFGGGVGPLERLPDAARDRRDRHDGSAASSPHLSGDGLHEPERAHHVDRKEPFDVSGIYRLDRAADLQARIVDQHVDPVEALDQGGDGGGIGDVEGQRLHPVDRRDPRGVARGGEDGVACVPQSDRDLPTDPSVSTGHECNGIHRSIMAGGSVQVHAGSILAKVGSTQIEISLEAVIVAVTDDSPRVLTVQGDDGLPALPSGLLEPQDRTLDVALRRWVQGQTGLEVGYVEQLYTFGDQARGAAADESGAADTRLLSIAYLALVREGRPSTGASWKGVYDFFPWEDQRGGRPPMIEDHILPALQQFVAEGQGVERQHREDRLRIMFGLDEAGLDGVRVLERYELLYEAGLLHECPAGRWTDETEIDYSLSMSLDHRRIAATALGRLRGKLTYRPVVFELLPDRFTLLALQRVVEALAGIRLHKQNFRRLVEGAGLVEGTGELARTGGRPAELFRFRREVLRERPRPGVGTPWVRS